MFQVIPVTEENIFAFKATGKLTDEDYQKFLPQIEELIESTGSISLLLELEDFHGWDARAAWDDFEFGHKHKNDFLRIAIVGENRWQHWMTTLGKAFGPYEIRYFDRIEFQAAWSWLREKPVQPSVPAPPQSQPGETKSIEMKPYQHILVAMDFSPYSNIALSRAVELARHYSAKVSLIHAVESAAYVSDSLDMNLIQPYGFMETDQLIFDNAQDRLSKIGQNVGLENVRTAVLWGTPQSAIRSYAEAQNIDLIVVGSHGRHGLARLLGSTAATLTHSAKCDVIVVKSTNVS